MPQIIRKERTAHLASYTFLQELLINIKTRQSHSSINDLERLFHRTLLSYEYCNVFKNIFLIGHLQMQSFADVLQNRCS